MNDDLASLADSFKRKRDFASNLTDVWTNIQIRIYMFY